MKFLITSHISNLIIKHYENFDLLSWIVIWNALVHIFFIIWVFNKAVGFLKCFRPTSSCLLTISWYLGPYRSLAYRYILSISGWWFTTFNSAYLCPVQIAFVCIFSCNLIEVNHYIQLFFWVTHLFCSPYFPNAWPIGYAVIRCLYSLVIIWTEYHLVDFSHEHIMCFISGTLFRS